MSVNTEPLTVTSGAPLSLRAYARRRGVSAPAVLRAVRSGRLKECLVLVGGKAKVRDVDAADAEWSANTDLSKAPGYVKDRASAGGATPPRVSALSEASAKEKHWKARLAELEYLRKTGQLIDLAEATREGFESSRTIRQSLENIPARVSGEFAAESDAQKIFARLTEEIRRACAHAAVLLEGEIPA